MNFTTPSIARAICCMIIFPCNHSARVVAVIVLQFVSFICNCCCSALVSLESNRQVSMTKLLDKYSFFCIVSCLPCKKSKLTCICMAATDSCTFECVAMSVFQVVYDSWIQASVKLWPRAMLFNFEFITRRNERMEQFSRAHSAIQPALNSYFTFNSLITIFGFDATSKLIMAGLKLRMIIRCSRVPFLTSRLCGACAPFKSDQSSSRRHIWNPLGFKGIIMSLNQCGSCTPKSDE